MFPVELTLDDLTLRELTADDFGSLNALFSDPAVTNLMLGAPLTLAEVNKRLGDWLSGSQNEPREEYMLVKQLPNVSFAGVSHLRISGQSAALSGANLPEYQSQGLSTDGLKLLKQLAFDLLGLQRVWAVVHKDNIAAQTLVLSGGLMINDNLSTHDHFIYEEFNL